MTNGKRVLIIGVDGATFDLIDPWVAEGYLPNIGRLTSMGCRGRLLSTIQPATAPAWVTFMTGVNQGKHGLYDFVRRQSSGYNLEVTNASHVYAPTIFEIASQLGRRVITVNVPYTFPPRPINGVMIGGPFAPAVTRDMVFPPDYFDVIRTIAPDYFILPDYDPRAADPLADFAVKLLKDVELRERLSLHLMQTEPWDLFAVVFMATDEVQHSYWHCQDAPDGSPLARYRHVIRDVYQRIDQAIGAFLTQVTADDSQRETVVFVLSDHGAGPFRWMINLNHWLAEHGYLRFLADSAGPSRQLQTTTLKWLAHVYRHYMPSRIRRTIRNGLGGERFNRIKGEFESALVTSAVDWSQTQAYALGVGGNVFINLEGREPCGIVRPGTEYEKLRQGIIDALATLAEPGTDVPVVRHVYRREELYHGTFLDHAPDLIIEWQDYACWGRGSYGKQGMPVFEAQRQFDFSDQPLSGSHRPEGILIAHGSSIRSGTQIEGPHLLDLAPTILSLLGIEPLPSMDGRLLEAMLIEDEAIHTRQSVAEFAASTLGDQVDYSPEEAERISKHLHSLGYL